jgi:Cys-tRNA(Pro)/Cys-tRNA(Cys) deacylase
MKLPSHEYLDRNHIPYETRSFPDTTEKGAANVAKILGLTESQVVKTLIFQTDKGDRALIMVAANQNAISGLLKKALGSRNISLAKPEVVVEVTGYVIGSIPPFHWQPEGFSTIVDAALMREPVLGVGAGVWGNEILIEPQRLVAASNAKVINLTEKEPPGEPPVVA